MQYSSPVFECLLMAGGMQLPSSVPIRRHVHSESSQANWTCRAEPSKGDERTEGLESNPMDTAPYECPCCQPSATGLSPDSARHERGVR